MKALSLFAGIGGIDLGLQWAGFEIVGQVEIDDYCKKALAKNFPKAKRWSDIRTVSAHDIRKRCGTIDIISGGFPCQDVSAAGKKAGLAGGRSGLWREMWRLIRELRPGWVLVENVPDLKTRGADTVIVALEALGYTCWPVVVGAWACGAPHRRNRVWIVAHRHGLGLNRKRSSELRRKRQDEDGHDSDGRGSEKALGNAGGVEEPKQHSNANSSAALGNPRRVPIGASPAVSNTDREPIRKQSRWSSQRRKTTQPPSPGKGLEYSESARLEGEGLFAFPAGFGQEQFAWEESRVTESKMGLAADGLPIRLALTAIGNAVVPQIPYLIGLWIMSQKGEKNVCI